MLTTPKKKYPLHPSDEWVYLRVMVDYGHLPYADAVRRVAEEKRASYEGITAMVRRARWTREIKIKEMALRAKTVPKLTPAELQIKNIVQDANERDLHVREMWKKYYKDKLVTGMFISDIHLPNANYAALDLVSQLIEYIQPDLISAMSDVFDNPKLSSHVDKRRLREQAYDTDISNSIGLVEDFYKHISDIRVGAHIIAVHGNHDNWLHTYSDNNGLSIVNDTLIAEVMERLTDAGVCFVAPIKDQNVYRLNDGLVWYHGSSTSRNAQSRVLTNFEHVQRQIGNVFTDMITGHLHASNITNSNAVKGITLYESPCLCSIQQPYLRYGASWDWGFVLSHFTPTGRYHDTNIIKFLDIGTDDYDQFSVRYDGKNFVSGKFDK